MLVSTDKARAALGVAFLAWMVVVLVAFYAVQKPIMPPRVGEPGELDQLANSFARTFNLAPTFGGLANVALDLAVALAITIGAIGVGGFILHVGQVQTGMSGEARLESWLLSVGLGFGVLGIGAFLLGLFGFANPLALGTMCIAVPLALGYRVLPSLWQDALAAQGVTSHPVRLFLVATLVMSFLAALMPATAYDSWLYHLTLPRRALEMGRIAPLLEVIPHEGWPSLMPSLYLIALSVRGDSAAQLLHYAFGLLTLLLIALTARRWYSSVAGNAVTASVLLTLSMPMFALLSSWAYSDVGLAFYHLSAAYAYRRFLDSRIGRYLLLSGILAGFAVGMKYTAFVLPMSIAAHLILRMKRDAVVPLLFFAAAVACVSSPWLLKNWIFFGNPVFPFAFGGAGWDELRAAWYAQAGTGIGVNLSDLISLPIVAMQGYRDANFWDGRIGPLVLVFAPLLLVRTPGGSETRLRCSLLDPFLFAGTIGVLTWIIGVTFSIALWQTRLLLPSLVLVMPSLGAAFARIELFDLPALSFARICRVLFAVVLTLGVFRQAVELGKLNPFGVLAGSESRDAFVERQWPEHVHVMHALDELPDSSRVQFLWEPRTYLARRPVRADAILDALPHQTAVAGSIEDSIAGWKSEGFTHVLIFDAGAAIAMRDRLNSYTPTDAENLRLLRDQYSRVVYQNSAYSVLELK